jgi:hypothetical protein
MNDTTNLYLAIRFKRTFRDPGNSASFEFNNADGGQTLAPGDDGLIINPDIGFFDLVRTTNSPCPPGDLCSVFDTDVGGRKDGAGQFTNNGTYSIYEFSHPLDSGDTNDFNLSPGKTVLCWPSIRLLNLTNYADTDPPAFEILIASPPPGPVALCAAVVVNAGTNCVADASVDNGSYDPIGDIVTLSQSPPGPYPLGTNVVILTVTDSHGKSNSCAATVTVVDQTAPRITASSARPNVLWPPDHKMVEVRLTAEIADTCSPATWRIIAVTSNEGTTGDKGNPSPADWEITGEHTVMLRAERAGNGADQIYTIALQAADGYGNLSSSYNVTVRVPHDARGL